MNKLLVFILATILSFNSYAQITFEKGYYINNANQKINCLIKNIDWKNNPNEFEYKISGKSKLNKGTLKSIKEFGINHISKYVKSTVNIDRSSEIINNLSNKKNPILRREELFLKVLVEGKATLYEYVDGNLRKYFYSKDNFNIEQLIFKSYKTDKGKIQVNNKFKQQLWNSLKCPNFKRNKFENLEYKKNKLVRFFVDYNNCYNNEYINFEKKEKKDLFNLTIRPRLNNSSLTIKNSVINSRNTDFGNKIGIGFGLEAEFILPFNKNKWSIAIEPTYQNFKSKKAKNVNNVSGGVLIANINYHSIEVPMSLRHYFFLNSKSKFFVNISYIFDVNSKSSIEFTRHDNSNLSLLKIKSRNNFSLGIGYKQNDKYSLEIRHQTNRNVLGDYSLWNSKYKTFSIIFGYSLF